jgi:flagellar hook-length control protein FliK
LNLIPEDLGEVQITLRRTLSGLRVQIEVEKVSTANVLQADISTLTEKLSGSSQGLTTTVINIEVRDDIEHAARSSQLEANLYGGPGAFSGSMSGMNKRSNPDKQELAFPSMSRREDDNEPQSRSAILGVVV